MTPDPVADLDGAVLGEQGYAVLRALIDSEMIRAARDACPLVGRAGLRNLLQRMPEARAIADSPAVQRVAQYTLGPRAHLARAILFDKAPGAN